MGCNSFLIYYFNFNSLPPMIVALVPLMIIALVLELCACMLVGQLPTDLLVLVVGILANLVAYHGMLSL